MAATRLAFYNHTGDISGAEGVLLTLLRGLDRSRFTLSVFSPAGPLAEACHAEAVPHLPVPDVKARFTANPLKLAAYLGGIANAVLGLRSALRHQRPDIFHANSVRAGLVASFSALGLGIPVVWHIHDILPDHPVTTIIRRWARLAPRTSLLAVSRATAACFRGPLDPARPGTHLDLVRKPITVVYNSIDLDRFVPSLEGRQRFRHELGLTEHQVAVGVIGQITARKGQLELIRAFAQARHRMPHVVLVIVGAALFNDVNRDYGLSLTRLIEQLKLEDQVWMIGKRSDVDDVVNGLDLLAQNSFHEPLGLALMEGFATGKTAAATGVDGVLEIIVDGTTGLLSRPNDPADLVAKIEILANDPALRRTLGLNARAKMLAEFGPAHQIAQMHAFYDTLAPAPAPAAVRTVPA